MGQRSHDFSVELRMHSLIVDCDTFIDEEKVIVVVLVTSVVVEVTVSEAMLALSFSTLL